MAEHYRTGRSAPHVYLSTACLHGEHDYCNSTQGHSGEKKPGRCKFCDALCVCPECHGATGHRHDITEFGPPPLY